MSEHRTISVDTGSGKDICVGDRFMGPTAEYPDGSWLHTVDGKVEVATGCYAKMYPDKPSPYFHGRAPFVVINTADWPWGGKS